MRLLGDETPSNDGSSAADPATQHRAVTASLRLPRVGSGRQRLASGLALVLMVSVGACVWAAWQHDGHPTADTRNAAASDRDSARAATTAALEVLMSADHRAAAQTLDEWSAVTTGKLHARLVEQRKVLVRKLRKNGELTTAAVVDSGLSSWDGESGTARLLAVLELGTQNKAAQEPSSTVVHYLALAQRVDGEWRLSAVQQLGEAS